VRAALALWCVINAVEPTRASHHVTTFCCVKMLGYNVSCRDVTWRPSGIRASFEQSMWAERKTERSGPKTDFSGAERSGAERSGIQKMKWNVSGAGAGGRRHRNWAVSGQNLPLKIRSSTKPLKSKKSKKEKVQIDFKSYHETVSVNSLLLFVVSRTNVSEGTYHFSCAALWSGHVKCRNFRLYSYAQPGPAHATYCSNSLSASIFNLL